jgi:predicted RND superfamily exporter protein
MIFLTVAILCGFLSGFVSVNYKMTDYLPDNAQSTTALKLMDKEFGSTVPNARIMMPVTSIEEAMLFKEKLKSVAGISDVLFLDSSENVKIPIEMMDAKIVDTYYKDGKALYNVTVKDGMELAAVKGLYQLTGDTGALSGDAVNNANNQQMAVKETLKAMLFSYL